MPRHCILGLMAFALSVSAARGELRHQYTFNDGTANDSAGDQHGTVVNPMGHVVRFGGQLDLRANNAVPSSQPMGGDNTSFTQGIYVDLPNFLVSNIAIETTGIVSFEIWATQETRRTWSRLFDLGTSNAGEDTATSGSTSDYIFLTPQSGGNSVQLTTRNGALQVDGNAALGPALSINVPHHYVSVIDQSDTTAGPDGTMSLYIDGALADTGPVAASLFIDAIFDDNNWLGRSQWNDPLFDGTFDEFRVYDHALTAQEVAANFAEGPDPFTGTNPTFVINRDNQTISLRNPGATGDVAGYTLTSAFGSLNNEGWTPIAGRLDSAGDGSFDNVAWNEGASTTGELSESASSGTGGSLATGTPISLGAAWYPSPVEDVAAQAQLGDGTIVNAIVAYEGNAGAAFARSDLNFDGVLDAADWGVYVENLFGDFAGMSLAQAYALGDLNRDLLNNVADFRLFKADFIAANGAAAFAALGAAVPEPASVVLAASLLAGFALVRSRKLGLARVRRGGFKWALVGCVAATILLTSASLTQAQLVHQWTFNELGGTAASDSVGGAQGQLIGAGASLGGGVATLSGWTSATAPYIDLPNGIVSALTDATFEGWAIQDGAQSWARLFDFGSSAGGELNAPGGGGEGQDYFMLSSSRGTDINLQRLEFRNLDPAFGGADAGNVTGTTQLLDTGIPTPNDTEFHFAVVFDSQLGEMREYRDGALVAMAPVTFLLENLNDVNNWLGRSNWTNDANFQGSFNEFRIYDQALSDAEILASFEEGPEPFAPPVLELQVNTITGEVELQNNNPGQPIEFDFYEITSPDGALSTSGWDSLSDQEIDSMGSGFGESWDEAGNSDALRIGEAFLLGSTTIEDGMPLSLGRAFNTAVFGLEMDGDLEFQYSIPLGATVSGIVSYIAEGMPPTGIDGDYNDNGTVEQADLDLVLLNWGQSGVPNGWVNDLPEGNIDQAELDGVLLNWGNMGSLGAASGVPEPSTAVLLALAVLLAAIARTRRSCRA